jgi:tetratricopeptide (TPR) repeat protein
MNAIQNELLRGWQIHQQKRLFDAEQIYRKVLSQAPNDANAWCYLGIAMHDQRKFAEAVECYRKALAINAKFPIALNNLGNSLRYVNCIDEADACFQKAIDLKPDYLNAYKNRGTLHVWTGSLALGLKYYEEALKINPNEGELHRNLGVIYLLQGRFEEGWREYRWRWRVGDLHRPNIQAPVWDGSNLKGKRILLSVEQGLGDTIHFVRYAEILRNQGAKTVVYCQPPLMALLQNSSNIGPVYPNSLAYDQPTDFQCSLIDVADILKTDTTNIPGRCPYIEPAQHLVQYWQQRFPKSSAVKRIGIAWQGNPDHQADVFRSVPLKAFEPLAELPNVELVSLQGGFGSEQIATWKGARPILALGNEIDKSSGAFMDTAAIMRQMDLVITSDTSIAHLAGALAVPTWIAVGYIPDWRWLLEREDSPWYPTVKLFRQPKLGDWESVFCRMRDRLASTQDAT